MKTLSKKELAGELNVATRTIERWIGLGCPHVRDAAGVLHFELAAVRAWREGQGAGAEDPLPSAVPVDPLRPASIRDAAQRADAARKAAQARRQEHELQQEKGLKDLGLDEKVRAATTPADLADLAREVTAHVAAGTLSPQRGQALRQLLTETRHAVRAREREATAGGDGRLLLVTVQAREVAEQFDRLINGWRRRWVQDAVAAHLAEDGLEFPDGAEHDLSLRLPALGLDGHGDPVGPRPAGYELPPVPPAMKFPVRPPVSA